MRLRPMLPVLLLAFALSIAVGVLAAARGSQVTLALAAALFAIQVLLVVWRISAPLWNAQHVDAATLDWARDSAVLAALVYAWGSLAMLSIYAFTELAWRHWWQYGAGMALLAAAALTSTSILVPARATAPRARALDALMGATTLQAAAVVGALGYLVASGKLGTTGPDWAANHVFVAGGLTIVLISLVSLVTYRRLRGARL